MKKLNIGVLGVSNHLTKRIVLPLKHTQYCEITAIASRDIEKAKKFAAKFNIDKFYSNYQDLIDDTTIDLVYIPLPNHLHLEWVKKAAQAGKHILCEKPITLNANEAAECIKEVNNNNVKLMEAFMYKFHPQWEYINDVIRTNQIGKIMYINTSFAYNNPAVNNIRNIKEYGGGAIMDIGCYAISVPRFLLGKEPQRVISLQQECNNFKTDTLSSALLDFNGIHSSFTVSTLSHPNQYVEIIGSSGRIKVQIPFNTYVDTKAEVHILTAQGERTVYFDICDQYGLMFDAFSKAIINNEPTPIDPSDALYNMKVIDAIFKSSESNQWEQISD